MYFAKPGKLNTEVTLKKAKEVASKREINYIIVASTSGYTGVLAAELFKDDPVEIVVVTHNTGFKETGAQEFDDGARKKIESLGGKVYTGTMVLRGLGTAIRGRGGYSYEQIVADTLRIMGPGIKVCVEIAAMASDAGLIPLGDVIAIAGTERGADTAVILKADSSNHFFQIKVREILAKPADF
jgi:hypothetical protein